MMVRNVTNVPKELFLSHATGDRRFVRRLVGVLRSNQVPVWHSGSNIGGAQQWHDEIGNALERCDWFAIVLSPTAARSKWVKREQLFALQQDRFVDKIIPIHYQPCDIEKLSWTLASIQRVDFTDHFDAGCRRLLQIWGRGLASPGRS